MGLQGEEKNSVARPTVNVVVQTEADWLNENIVIINYHVVNFAAHQHSLRALAKSDLLKPLLELQFDPKHSEFLIPSSNLG